jgi:hypothetical protein
MVWCLVKRRDSLTFKFTFYVSPLYRTFLFCWETVLCKDRVHWRAAVMLVMIVRVHQFMSVRVRSKWCAFVVTVMSFRVLQFVRIRNDREHGQWLMNLRVLLVQLSATRCSCITTLWVILESFAVITLCVASQRVFIVSLSTQSRNFWIHARTLSFRYCLKQGDALLLSLFNFAL